MSFQVASRLKRSISLKIVVTGGAGLIGSTCCRYFAEQDHTVLSIDNYKRGDFFGEGGNTKPVMESLMEEYEVEHHSFDIRNDAFHELLVDCDAVVHTAAQPSHSWSIGEPYTDFQINAEGTVKILETLRTKNSEAKFIFCSSNKVYGEVPNYYSYEKVGRRFEPKDNTLWNGFDETTRIDRSSHTPFGVSKTTGDLYTQEYARMYDLQTGVFRMGCVTGGAAQGVEMHNWEPFFVQKAIEEEPLTIFGYEGYQVRDVLHAEDLAGLFLEFLNDPRAGEVYNVGGGRQNSISLLESIDLIENITGNKINFEYGAERKADHQWWISDIRKARDHYQWEIETDLWSIFNDIYESLQENQ